jgi:protein NEDD1
MKSKKQGLSVLGLGTPEVNKWISMGAPVESTTGADKGKGKNVGFQEEDDQDSDDDGPKATIQEEDGEKDEQPQRSLSMQISPRRPPPIRSSNNTWAPSPLRNMSSSNSLGGNAGSGGSAQDFLRNIVHDIMYDYQQETRAEITGLHLDLVKMGRNWKKELREIMDEYVGDLKDLREENRRLREENDRLRRGY